MPLERATITNLDLGNIQDAVDKAITEMVHDINRRPDVESARKVVLTLVIEPEVHVTPNGTFNSPNIAYKVTTTVPAQAVSRTKAFIGIDEATGEDGVLMVSTNLPGESDPRQENILDMVEARKEKS